MKQSTGLSGNIVAAQVNSRGNYLVCINGFSLNQRSYSGGSVLEISPKGSIITVYSQKGGYGVDGLETTSFIDMYLDKANGYTYLLPYSPFKGIVAPKGTEVGVIVLDSNLNEIKRLLINERVIGDEGFTSITSNTKFIYSSSQNQLFFIARTEYQGIGHAIFQVNSDNLVQLPNYPLYYLNYESSAAFLGDKMITILRKTDYLYNFRNNGKSKLSYSEGFQLPDTTTLEFKLQWSYYESLHQYTDDQVLVYGWNRGKTKFALLNRNLEVDTTSLIIRNLVDSNLEFIHSEGNNVLLKKRLSFKDDTVFTLNNNHWQMNIDGSNLRPSEINWYADPSNQSKDFDWFGVIPIKGSNNYFTNTWASIFLIENNKVNYDFFKMIGPNLSTTYDIKPTINNQWFVLGRFDYYNNKKVNGLVRINADGSPDTTFKFSVNKFPFIKDMDVDDKRIFDPEIISPLKNGDLIMSFVNGASLIPEYKGTFKLDRFGKVKEQFKLDDNPIFPFNKVQDFGTGKYLVHRLENFNDREYRYRSAFLDINITDTNGKTLNQLLVAYNNSNEAFHLVKVKIIDSTHYLLAFCRQTELEQDLEKGEFYIYKLSIFDQHIMNSQPIYYRKLTDFSFIDFSNDGTWSIKIQNKKSKNIFKIIQFNDLGIVTESYLTTNPYVGLYPHIQLLDNLKLSLKYYEDSPNFEKFNLFKSDTVLTQLESSDFANMGLGAYYRNSGYNRIGPGIQRINDTSFWYFSNRIIFNNENKGSVSGFFRIKIKETKITSEPDQLNVKVYPNPTNSIASIELPFYYEDGLNCNLMVTDISGKQMFKDSFNLLKYENLQFDFSNYNSGLYFIRIETNGRIYYTKVVKR
ncbi:MAG: T9SS type A sorting domain-containing protein [Flexibacteraceae bacterium]